MYRQPPELIPNSHLPESAPFMIPPRLYRNQTMIQLPEPYRPNPQNPATASKGPGAQPPPLWSPAYSDQFSGWNGSETVYAPTSTNNVQWSDFPSHPAAVIRKELGNSDRATDQETPTSLANHFDGPTTGHSLSWHDQSGHIYDTHEFNFDASLKPSPEDLASSNNNIHTPSGNNNTYQLGLRDPHGCQNTMLGPNAPVWIDWAAAPRARQPITDATIRSSGKELESGVFYPSTSPATPIPRPTSSSSCSGTLVHTPRDRSSTPQSAYRVQMGTPVGASAQNVTRDKEVRRLMSPILRPKSNLVPMAPGLEQWNSSAALFLPFAVKDPSPFAKNAPFPESRDWAYATLMQWVLSLNLRRLNDIAGQFAKGDYPNATYHLALGLALSAEPEDPIFGLLQNQYGIDVVLVQEMSCIPGIDLMSRPYTAADVAPEELARCMRLVEADRVVPIPGFERAPSDAKLPRMPLRSLGGSMPSIPPIRISEAPNRTKARPAVIPHVAAPKERSSRARQGMHVFPTLNTPHNPTSSSSYITTSLLPDADLVSRVAGLIREVYIRRGIEACEGQDPLTGRRRQLRPITAPCPINVVTPDIRSKPAKRCIKDIVESGIIELQNDARKLTDREYQLDDEIRRWLIEERTWKLVKSLAEHEDLVEFVRGHVQTKCPHVRLRMKELKERKERRTANREVEVIGMITAAQVALEDEFTSVQGAGPIRRVPSGRKERQTRVY